MSVAQLRTLVNRRHQIAGDVAAHLSEFEADLARTLSSGSRLIGLLPTVRSDASLSPVVGQAAIGHFVAALTSINEAMERTNEGHHSLEATRVRFRIPIVAAGDKDEIPPIRP